MGAPVTFRGVRVGSVQGTALHISSTGRSRVPVVMELMPGQVLVDGHNPDPRGAGGGLGQLVAAGLRAQLGSQSFVTGQLRVDLDFHPGAPAAGTPAEADGLPVIPTIPSDFERLRNTLAEVPVQDVVQTAHRALISVEHLAARLDAELGPLLGDTRRGIVTATRVLDTTEQTMVGLRSEVTRSLGELNGLLGEARTQLGDRGAELSSVLVSADRAAQRGEALLATLDGLAGPRSQFRGDLEATARDVSATAASLRGFARELERDPSAVIRGRNGR